MPGEQQPLVIGVISDTHGPLTAEAAGALAGVDHLLHAGDIVAPEVVPALEAIAPVTVVRGNMDYAGATNRYPAVASVELGGVRCHILHDLGDLDLRAIAGGVGVVVHGHTHCADVTRHDGVLYVNPGSAGRGGRPTVARITIAGGEASAEIIEL